MTITINFKTRLLTYSVVLMTVFSGFGQKLWEDDQNYFGTSGYIRTGIGQSEGGATQAHFQMPGALNKFSLGNQADTYGELEFDYTRYINKEKNQSLDVVWMTSFYEAFGSENGMQFDKTAQLYVRGNNLLGNKEVLWIGKRYYHRQAIHLLDKQWMNPAQTGWGLGIENLITNKGTQDFKLGAWAFEDKEVVSYLNQNQSVLKAFTADARWVHVPVSKTSKINLAVNYSIRAANPTLDYETRHGFGAFAWLDTEKKNITNTFAVLFRQGATVAQHHWTGMSQKENPNNNQLVLNDLRKAYALEINNNFLYDDLDRFAINGILMSVYKDFGTQPYNYQNGTKSYLENTGDKLYWIAVGARGMYYLNRYFKLSLELSTEYVNNQQVNVEGNLQRISFTPEISLNKGFYNRPVLRPLITYAFWSNDLMGHIGTTPTNAPFGNNTEGFTLGLQFEIWW